MTVPGRWPLAGLRWIPPPLCQNCCPAPPALLGTSSQAHLLLMSLTGISSFIKSVFATSNGQSWSVLKVLKTINPLTPRAFYQRHTFWTFRRFSACIWAKLAPIYSKRHWQRDILLFPLVSQFVTFLLRHAQKSKFRDFWTRK